MTNGDKSMTDLEKRQQFEELVSIVSQLQSDGPNPEIHKETKEDLIFEL